MERLGVVLFILYESWSIVCVYMLWSPFFPVASLLQSRASDRGAIRSIKRSWRRRWVWRADMERPFGSIDSGGGRASRSPKGETEDLKELRPRGRPLPGRIKEVEHAPSFLLDRVP